jgi:hypothetical protein
LTTSPGSTTTRSVSSSSRSHGASLARPSLTSRARTCGRKSYSTTWAGRIRDGIGLEDAVAVLLAVASGHGVGKSALVAWIILWFISTRENPQIVVTAGTQEQLRSKTWRELAKWHKLSINRDWFKWTATRLYNVEAPEQWFASAIPWSANNPDRSRARTKSTCW